MAKREKDHRSKDAASAARSQSENPLDQGKLGETPADSLIERLTGVEGLSCRPHHSLARRSTLRIGGPADFFAEAAGVPALGALLREVDRLRLPFVVLGHGANVLIPDRGLRGVVACLGGELAGFELDSCGVVAGAAVPMARLARAAARRGLGGLEALAGFPSTVGGAVFMNAGCYGTETKDILVEVRLLDRQGEEVVLPVAELDARYRHTALFESGMVVTSARFDLIPGDPQELEARIDELNRRRRQSLPSGRPNAGSVFKNPEGDSAGRLLDAAGLKGEAVGAAQISERHANVIVNLGGAKASEVVELMARAQRAVRARFGVSLEPELRLLGELEAGYRGLIAA
ncbi:MAG TPA: UDP-N-acetylmuramate dehydrogenase [Thermoanaerobaculia bacterium]|nr:UDP-N-acetylmuramate dehydrogenase [Thermoanaerobaculia bacterium]